YLHIELAYFGLYLIQTIKILIKEREEGMKNKEVKIAVYFMLLMIMAVLLGGCSGGVEKGNAGNNADLQEAVESVNSADFSGLWEGTALIAEVSNSEEYKSLEGAVFFCELVLDVDPDGNGFANLYMDGELVGPKLTAVVVQDRPHLAGELFSSPFEWYGTFSDETGAWVLKGGGDVHDGDAVIHMVIELVEGESVAQAPEDPSEPEAPATSTSGGVSADAPLDQFLVGSWMRDELFGEFKVKSFNADGSATFSMDKPSPGDDINNWPGGGWKIVESATGKWITDGAMLIASVTPEHLSLDTEVKIVDENTIEIVEMHTKTLYYRVP
ncbi:MAG: hypothetical protein U1E11_05845, partial [Dethiobacteria bacterium]|nr:hypothetical protein [Dethiobacteria bacterium]